MINLLQKVMNKLIFSIRSILFDLLLQVLHQLPETDWRCHFLLVSTVSWFEQELTPISVLHYRQHSHLHLNRIVHEIVILPLLLFNYGKFTFDLLQLAIFFSKEFTLHNPAHKLSRKSKFLKSLIDLQNFLRNFLEIGFGQFMVKSEIQCRFVDNTWRIELVHPPIGIFFPRFLPFCNNFLFHPVNCVPLIGFIKNENVEKPPFFEPPKVFEFLEEWLLFVS